MAQIVHAPNHPAARGGRKERLDEKAWRLTQQPRVTFHDATRATVVGDHDTYAVHLVGTEWRCNCDWAKRRTAETKPCSHAWAAAMASTYTAPVAPDLTVDDVLSGMEL